MENNSSAGSGNDLKQAYRVAYLVAGFIREQLTNAERDELDQWILAKEENMQLFGELINEENLASSLAAFDKMDVERQLAASKESIQLKKQSIVHFKWWFAAAAMIILVTGFWWINSDSKNSTLSADHISELPKDILPGFQQAVLLTDKGKQQALEIGKSDTVLAGGLYLNRSKGELLYGEGKPGQEVEIHQLLVPRKGTFTAVLPDGTRVKLNAESSLRYPTVFFGLDRTVQLTGEAYFEVAKDAAKPFRVEVGGTVVEAVGTAFNIYAYGDEDILQTSLVEGKVRVSAGEKEQLLQAGQKSAWNGKALTVGDFNAEEVLAWTNNNFVFRDAPIEEIMKQVQRWYDAEIIFKDKVNFHLNATIKRDLPVSRLLELLEQTGHAHFKIENNKIIISK